MRTPPGPGYRQFCELARQLPGVEESTAYGTPSLRVKGASSPGCVRKQRARSRLRVDPLDRQILLQADPGDVLRRTTTSTTRWCSCVSIVMRRKAMKDLLMRSWRLVAPARLVADYDAAAKR